MPAPPRRARRSTTASAVEKSSTDVDGVAVTGTNVVAGEGERDQRARADQTRSGLRRRRRQRRAEPLPPSTAASRRRADAPRAARIAAWPRSARASSRFARLAHAIRSRTAEVRNSTVSELENWRCISGTPPPAGVTTICWRGSWRRSSFGQRRLPAKPLLKRRSSHAVPTACGCAPDDEPAHRVQPMLIIPALDRRVGRERRVPDPSGSTTAVRIGTNRVAEEVPPPRRRPRSWLSPLTTTLPPTIDGSRPKRAHAW